MSYSFDNMDGWDLFNMPFSKPVRTAPARQQAARSQQKPSEPTQRNVTPPEPARRNPTPAQTQKTPPLSHHAPGTQPKQPAVKQPEPVQATPTAPAPDKQPAPKAVTPAPEQAPAQAAPTKPEPADSPKAPASTQPAVPQKELVLDMSSGSDAAQDDTARRKAHEAAEAKRKSEWESAKKQADEAALQKLNAMSDEEAIAASLKRVSADVEKITRRNMKECVAAHIQERARQDALFARRVISPSKNVYNCFRYIYRMAKAYIQQSMAENDIQPENGIYGGDVPDDMVYQFSIDYYNSDNLPEDEATEEKFIPKPYVPAPSKQAKKKEKKSKKQQKTQSDGYEQMSLEGVIG